MRFRLRALGILTVALFIGLALPLIRHEVFIDGDLGRYHFPIREWFARCLSEGEDYTWSPHLFCGFYLHGEGQGGFFHPWHQFLYRSFDVVTAVNLETLATYVFLFTGMLFFLACRFPLDGALVGALTFTFSGFTLSHFAHVNAIAIVAHYPWLLLAIDILWHTHSRVHLALAHCGIALLTA